MEPTIADLLGAAVTLTDQRGTTARYSVDHVGRTVAICSYVFAARQATPLRVAVGHELEIGLPVATGWIAGTGRVRHIGARGGLSLEVSRLRLEQRRSGYREDLLLPLHLTVPGEGIRRRGRTTNVSIGGFAGRLEGLPVPPGLEVVAELALPDGTTLTMRARKVGGDIVERFRFLGIDRKVEDRIAQVVRESELARRRSLRARIET